MGEERITRVSIRATVTVCSQSLTEAVTKAEHKLSESGASNIYECRITGNDQLGRWTCTLHGKSDAS